MSNINKDKKDFLKENGIGEGTTAWRAYVTSQGFHTESLVEDTKSLLISLGVWNGDMNSSFRELVGGEYIPTELVSLLYTNGSRLLMNGAYAVNSLGD